jgi:hypothetical protein
MPRRVNQDFAQNLVAGLNYGVTENQPNYKLPVSTGGLNYYGGDFYNNGTADYALFELVNNYFESLPVNYSNISVPWDGILNNNIEWEVVNYNAIQLGQAGPVVENLQPGGGLGGGLIAGTPTTYVGSPVQGDAWTKRSNGFHTFQIKLFNVMATIQILGTLDADPCSTNYTPIFLTNPVTGQTLNHLTFPYNLPSSYASNVINNFYTSIGQLLWWNC